jgi:hypothetical protein
LSALSSDHPLAPAPAGSLAVGSIVSPGTPGADRSGQILLDQGKQFP